MNDYVQNTCRIGQGNACCRYLVAGPKGLECAKFTHLKQILDTRAEAKTMLAQADNCEGLSEEESIKYLN